MGTLTTHLHHHPFFSLFSSLPTPTPTRCGTDHLVVQRFYRLLLVAALIAASGAIPLNDEILPEDNQFISVDNSAGDQTTSAVQSAQQVARNEAETDEPMSQGEVPLDEEELDDHGATEQAPSNDKLVVPEVIDRCHTESIADSLHPVIHGLSLSS